jgi:Leucine-rich repeat (LRR) protein
MNIENSQLKSLNNDFQWIENIKSLNLNFNNLSDVEIILVACKKLEKLEISNNNFTKLTFNFVLPNLAELDASGNKIKVI